MRSKIWVLALGIFIVVTSVASEKRTLPPLHEKRLGARCKVIPEPPKRVNYCYRAFYQGPCVNYCITVPRDLTHVCVTGDSDSVCYYHWEEIELDVEHWKCLEIWYNGQSGCGCVGRPSSGKIKMNIQKC